MCVRVWRDESKILSQTLRPPRPLQIPPFTERSFAVEVEQIDGLSMSPLLYPRVLSEKKI